MDAELYPGCDRPEALECTHSANSRASARVVLREQMQTGKLKYTGAENDRDPNGHRTRLLQGGHWP